MHVTVWGSSWGSSQLTALPRTPIWRKGPPEAGNEYNEKGEKEKEGKRKEGKEEMKGKWTKCHMGTFSR